MNSEIKEEKKRVIKGRDDKKRRPTYKAFKSKVVELKDAVFESRSVKRAALFTKTLEEIADYVQVKYKNDVARMIREVEQPVFKFPRQPTAQITTDTNGNPIQERFNEMEMYL